MTGDAVEHNTVHCRVCAYVMNYSTCVNRPGVAPSTGMFSVCMNCGEVSIYEVGPFGVALREPSMEELAEFHRQYSSLVRNLNRYKAQKYHRPDQNEG